jgi:2-polyprenyl-3-methyl-5-hydroxy-6-metoxy-1,4-benzoquinol methylase
MNRIVFEIFYITGLARISWHSEHPTSILDLALSSGWMKPGDRVLEVGCGLGTNTEWLARNGLDVTAVDLSRAAIRHARRRLHKKGLTARLYPADLLRGLDERPFDVVLDRATLHSFPQGTTRASFAAHLGELVKPGGSALLVEMRPAPSAPRGLPPFGMDQADLCALFPRPFEVTAVGEEIQPHRVRGDLVLSQWRVHRELAS